MKRYILPVYDPEELVADAKLHPGAPVRYRPIDFEIPFWRKLYLFARYRHWCQFERRFWPVFPGDPEYEDAQYEAVDATKISS